MCQPYELPQLNVAQTFVEYALGRGAIRLDRNCFTLLSKRKSPYHFDSAALKDGKSLVVLAEACISVLRHIEAKPQILYGPPLKGTVLAPVVAAIAFASYDMNVAWTSSRKEAKNHGEKGLLMGAGLQGADVFIIDNAITTGQTVLEAIDFVRARGGTVTGGIVVFDRRETESASGKSAIQRIQDETGVPIYAAATLDDLIAVLEGDTDFPGNHPDVLPMIKAYKARYGV